MHQHRWPNTTHVWQFTDTSDHHQERPWTTKTHCGLLTNKIQLFTANLALTTQGQQFAIARHKSLGLQFPFMDTIYHGRPNRRHTDTSHYHCPTELTTQELKMNTHALAWSLVDQPPTLTIQGSILTISRHSSLHQVQHWTDKAQQCSSKHWQNPVQWTMQ